MNQAPKPADFAPLDGKVTATAMHERRFAASRPRKKKAEEPREAR